MQLQLRKLRLEWTRVRDKREMILINLVSHVSSIPTKHARFEHISSLWYNSLSIYYCHDTELFEINLKMKIKKFYMKKNISPQL